MLNALLGWYLKEHMGAKTLSLVWEESLLANETGNYTIADARDGAVLSADLTNFDYLLYDVFAYADPGFVKITVRPDADSSRRFILEATKKSTRTTLPVPSLVESDLVLSVENEAVLNDIFISFSAIRLSEENLAKFTVLSELLFQYMPNAVIQALNLQSTAAGVSYSPGGPGESTGVAPCKRRGG